jgi:hypothetical protein
VLDRNTLTEPRLNPDRQGRDRTLTNPASLRRRQGGSRGHGPPVASVNPDRVVVIVDFGARAALGAHTCASIGDAEDRLHVWRLAFVDYTAVGSTTTPGDSHRLAVVSAQTPDHPDRGTVPTHPCPKGPRGNSRAPEPSAACVSRCASRVSFGGFVDAILSTAFVVGTGSGRAHLAAGPTPFRSASKPLNFGLSLGAVEPMGARP